uniref:Essential for reactive oxygen species protein n=1 Tax=Ursus maritimus TaxID=29073 RepID=A0A452UTJ9_URSMA
MYMQVESRTSSCLHLKRAPGIRSWSLLVGILSIGLAAAYYSGDSLGWKLFYVTGCLFVAVQNLEDWEVRQHRRGREGAVGIRIM